MAETASSLDATNAAATAHSDAETIRSTEDSMKTMTKMVNANITKNKMEADGQTASQISTGAGAFKF